jgi:hypothetical protein
MTANTLIRRFGRKKVVGIPQTSAPLINMISSRSALSTTPCGVMLSSVATTMLHESPISRQLIPENARFAVAPLNLAMESLPHYIAA